MKVGRKPCLLLPFIGHTLMAGVLIIMIFIMFIIEFIIMFIIEHNLITDRATIDNITSQVLILNVYFSHWPVEATLAEAMWGIFGGGYFSVRCNETFS